MSKKILIADDEIYLVELLKDMFVEAGYEVYTASDGDSTLTKIQTNKPDLILLDVMMPGVDGFDVTYYLSLDKDYTPKIIMITAKEREYDKSFAQAMGAHEYVTKPFDLNVLRDKVKELIGE